MFNASVLVWRNLFRFVMGAGVLLELFVSTIMNTKLKETHRLRPARRRLLRLSDHVQCFGARLEKFVPVCYGCWRAPRIICIHHHEHKAERNAPPAAGLAGFRFA
jgi:hypothetical protein